MRIGAHVSAAGGVDKAIDRAQELGCETLQLFCSPPQGWAFKPVPYTGVVAFRQKSRASKIGPAFIHAIYLINLGSPNPEILSKSVDALAHSLQTAAQLGAQGVILHAGSHKGTGPAQGFKQMVKALEQVLKQSPDRPWLMIENSAGMGDHLGARFEEIGRVVKALATPQMRVCLDTQHAFAAGYNVADAAELDRAIAQFDRTIGLDRLGAVHANDSKVPLGAGVDRHENIGEGHIGTAGFETILAHEAFQDVPFLLEVPGPGGKGPDKDNVERLKAIRERLKTKA